MAAGKTEVMTKEEREKRLSQAYNHASQDLREKYREEFNALYARYAADLGVDWKPRMKPEQKAEQELLTIFDAYPELRAKYAPTPGEGEPDPPA